MENKVLGLHHITAIASSAQQNFKFYTEVLGQRLVKKTVNFDSPETYHLYYGNEIGTPGTILTFFPWEGIGPGQSGTGMATEIGYSIPTGSIGFWVERFRHYKVRHDAPEERFGERTLRFQDPDGLAIRFIEPGNPDKRPPWVTQEIGEAVATRGFHKISLTLRNIQATAGILTDIFSYRLISQEDNIFRFETDAIAEANLVELVESPQEKVGYIAGGTNHHVAFRVENDEVLMKFREKIMGRGFQITDKIDRSYFFSLYFREPGGVLFELASNNPGFLVDEPRDKLGSGLKLPSQYEIMRKELEKVLIPL